ncbi:MAG: hypothetical protein ACRD50_14140 [Candidatus Acidiferrales bacterium]
MTGRNYYITTLAEWQRMCHCFANSHFIAADPSLSLTGSSTILALVEADEALHLELEQHAAWEALPHPLAAKPVGQRIARKLAGQGIAPSETAFEVAEKLSRTHPLLRHRVF